MDIQIHMSELRALENELGLSADVIVEAIEDALLHAYYRVPGAIRGARVAMDRKSGRVVVWAPEYDEEDHVIGEFDDTPKDFGRIATATAKSVIAQRLRDAETERVLGSFRAKPGDIVPGIVQQSVGKGLRSRDLFVRIGDQEAILRAEEQVPSERLSHGDCIRAYILDVSASPRGVSIRISRSHPDFVRALFTSEVPEIQDGHVEIIALAREAGHRTKIAVYADDPHVNAKGACIGHNGQRVRAITQELHGEKIDIITYSDEIDEFIGAALSPAKVTRVDILNKDRRMARAIVPDDQASLAIGKEAQNVRLAAKLTGWAIDVRRESEMRNREEGNYPSIPAGE